MTSQHGKGNQMSVNVEVFWHSGELKVSYTVSIDVDLVFAKKKGLRTGDSYPSAASLFTHGHLDITFPCLFGSLNSVSLISKLLFCWIKSAILGKPREATAVVTLQKVIDWATWITWPQSLWNYGIFTFQTTNIPDLNTKKYWRSLVKFYNLAEVPWWF